MGCVWRGRPRPCAPRRAAVQRAAAVVGGWWLLFRASAGMIPQRRHARAGAARLLSDAYTTTPTMAARAKP